MEKETIEDNNITVGHDFPYTDIPEKHHFIQRELCSNFPLSVLYGVINDIVILM